MPATFKRRKLTLKQHYPKPDLRSCLVWFIGLVVFLGIIIGISVWFGIG